MRKLRLAALASTANLFVLTLLLLGGWLLRAVPAAAADSSSETQVKAAFIYNFAKFTEWPAAAFSSAQSPIRLCITAADEGHVRALAGIEGKAAQGREVRIKRNPNPAEVPECHILYIGDEEPKRAQAALQAAKSGSVLTVSDNEGFADSGGVIGLVFADNRIQFEVNLSAAQRAGLKIASQVLKLARVVKDGKS